MRADSGIIAYQLRFTLATHARKIIGKVHALGRREHLHAAGEIPSATGAARLPPPPPSLPLNPIEGAAFALRERSCTPCCTDPPAE